MSGLRTINGIVALLILAGLAMGLGLAAAPARAGGHYGGYHYGGYGHYGYGHGYGHHGYGHGYSHYGYGYYPHYYGGYSHYGYGYAPRYYGGYSHDGGYHGGLLYGLLSIPSHVVGAVFGYPYGSAHHGGGSATPPTGGRGNAVNPYGSSNPAHDGGAAAPPSGGGSTAPPTGRRENTVSPYGSNGGGADGDAMDGAGWRRLAAGGYEQALSNFARQANGHPSQGLPKVGYALSAALAGDLGRGVWAMRRALRIDPHAVHYVYIGDTLRPKVEYLVGRYRSRSDRGDEGATFMLASLHYLLRDTASARDEIDLAVANGDRNPSTVNLEQLIAAESGGAEDRKETAVSGLSRDDRPQTADDYR